MSPLVSMDLTQRFIEGLRSHNLSYEDIKEGKFKYCGGDTSRHHNYFKMNFGNKSIPAHTDEYVCGHKIKENCYITDGKQILVLGNCCIKKFIPKCGRSCELCGSSHKNRIVNRCNQCRVGRCDKCSKPWKQEYKVCYGCKFNRNGGV